MRQPAEMGGVGYLAQSQTFAGAGIVSLVIIKA